MSATVPDRGHLGEDGVDLVVGGVQVGAEAEAGAGAVVAGVAAGDQGLGGLLGAVEVDDHAAATPSRVGRAADDRALGGEPLDQAGDLALGLGPDGLDAGLGDDPVALGGHHGGGHVRGAGDEPAGPFGEGDRAGPEGERGLVVEPADQPGGQGGGDLGAGGQVTGAGPAQQPLDRPADPQVDYQLLDVDRDRAGRLVGVEQDQGPHRMGPGGHGGRVEQGRGAEGDMGDGDQGGPLVDGLQQPLGVHGEVPGGDDLDLGPQGLGGPVEVVAGREL